MTWGEIYNIKGKQKTTYHKIDLNTVYHDLGIESREFLEIAEIYGLQKVLFKFHENQK